MFPSYSYVDRYSLGNLFLCTISLERCLTFILKWMGIWIIFFFSSHGKHQVNIYVYDFLGQVQEFL